MTTSAVSQVVGLVRPAAPGPLDRDALVRVAEAVARHPHTWASHLEPKATVRTYAALHRDADLDLWAIFWVPESDTGWHDHDVSSGAVHVVDGTIEEHVLRLGAPDRHRRHGAGAAFSFGPTQIHRLTCVVPRAISIHAYSPPLWRLGQYGVDAGGELHRVSVSYADELRPLQAPAAA
jgi:predicted metal-dependent enzyme (double-stranded beta helix superfamily)